MITIKTVLDYWQADCDICKETWRFTILPSENDWWIKQHKHEALIGKNMMLKGRVRAGGAYYTFEIKATIVDIRDGTITFSGSDLKFTADQVELPDWYTKMGDEIRA